MLAPLAGPANKQARVAADALCGLPSQYRGSVRSSLCRVFGLSVGVTGVSETPGSLTVRVHGGDRAGFYPGVRGLHLSVSFAGESGRLLGAQAAGDEGVDKRLDVLAALLQAGGTVSDLAALEGCYAPQVAAAHDVLNLAGMAAENLWRGLLVQADWKQALSGDSLKIDVRDPGAFKVPSRMHSHL